MATLLCADFINPLQAFANVDPEAALEAVDPLLVQAAALVRDNGGLVFDLSDTRLTACFDSRHSREDHALVACRTGLELRELVRDVPTVRTRIALDTGQVTIAPPRLADVGLEVRGPPLTSVHALNRALRSDLVAATERTYGAAGAAVRMEPLPPQQVSGFSRWQRLFSVVELAGASANS